jgi:uncharacterized coiled-coil protein SlyX
MADERLQERLTELRREYAVGEARLRELVQQEAALRETMLRISGAIQVLEELGSADPRPADGVEPDPQILKVP